MEIIAESIPVFLIIALFANLRIATCAMPINPSGISFVDPLFSDLKLLLLPRHKDC
jgi:hypothetical protein